MLNKESYFIAILPPEPFLTEINLFKKYFSENYNSKAAMRSPAHLTLHMPFEWKQEKEEKLFNSLAEFTLTQKRFETKLNNFGCFSPKVIYVKVHESNELENLQNQLHQHVKTHLQLFNANYQQRTFHPHITVAFRDLRKNIFTDAWKEFSEKKYEAHFSTNSICLLKHDGKQWNIRKEFKFGGN